MGCATDFVKIIVFSFNFVCSLVGLLLIGLGTWSHIDTNKYSDITKINVSVAPSLLIAVGVIIFLISFFGCCGVCQKSQWMLITYAGILLILFIVQLCAGIYGYIQVEQNKRDFNKTLVNELEKSFSEYNNNKAAADAFNSLQSVAHCCGVHGYNDYKNFNNSTLILPASCCHDDPNSACTDEKKAWKIGCGAKIYDLIAHSLKIVAYVAMGVAAVEVIGAVFAICLSNSIKNEERRRGHF